MSKVSYKFTAIHTASYYKLIGLCILATLILIVLFLTGLGIRLIAGKWEIGISVAILFSFPIALFYFRRKSTVQNVTAWLDQTSVEIHWPHKHMVIPFEEIKFYRTYYSEGGYSVAEGFDLDGVESVRIWLKDGRKMRVHAKDSVCDIKQLGRFRADFDTLAKNVGLKSKNFLMPDRF